VKPDDSSARDSQRSKVYAAEEFVRTLFDRAAEHGSTSVEFFGTQLTLPPEARFGSLAAVQRYCDDSGRRWRRCECGPDGPRLQLITKTATARELSRFPIWRPPTGRCVNWWSCMKSRTTSAM
jgi:hypothetical protein